MATPENESVSSALNPADFPEEGAICALSVEIDGEPASILVHRRNGRLIAWRNACPHQGRRLDYAPGRFLRDGERLVCAAHGATFSLDEGECVAGPCRGEHLEAIAWERISRGTAG